MGKGWIFPLVLAFAVCGVYGNSLCNGFVWDDNEIIVNNPVNRDLSAFGTLFRSADDLGAIGIPAPYYRPLNRLTYLLDYHIFGLNPVGYHAENILFHLVSVLCLYFLAIRLFNEPLWAMIAALFFAVHPLNAETVNFISARNNLLATSFVLLALITFLNAEENRSNLYRYLAGGFFFLGLLCKETAIMLLPFLFVYDMPTFRSLKQRFGEKLASLIPFIACAGIYFVLRWRALSGGSGLDLDLGRLGMRLAQDIYIIPRYGELLLFPWRLNMNYDIPDIFTASRWWLVPAWIALTGGIAYLWKTGRPVTKFGLLWCAINFLPVANIIPIPSAALADRFMYLPVIGLCLAAADQARFVHGKAPRSTVITVLLLLITLATLTIFRNQDWRDDITLFSSAVKTAPDSAICRYQLGVALLKKGDVANSEREFRRAVEIEPAHSDSYFQLASIRLMANSFVEAERYLTLAVRSNPGNAEALFNLALLLEKLGRPHEALEYYEKFLERSPGQYAPLLPKVRVKVDELRRK